MASPDTQHDPRLVAPDHLCASCGAPLAADQRYCLNCGRALERREDLLQALAPRTAETATATTAVAAAVPQAPPRTALSPLTAAAGAALLLLAVIAGMTIAGDDPQPAPQIRVAAAKAPNVTVSVPAGGSGTAAAEFVSDWPGEDGWTVQLQTLPKDSTDPAAVAAAKSAAQGQGAEDVGALDSDEYPSLDAGEYVVYSGVFDSKKAATKELRGLRKDFPDAKVVKVAATGGKAPKVDKSADKASDSELQDLQSAGGEDFVKKSKKLKDKVGTQGAAPKTDDKAPGGGSDDGAVIE